MTRAKSSISWAAAFVGIPFLDKGRDFDGCDCWGLVRLVHAKHGGNHLPSYAGLYTDAAERKEIAAIVAREAVSPLWEPVTEPRQLDILMFRRGRLDAHAAIFLQPGLMLHMVEEDCAKIEPFNSGFWSTRLTGTYRWRGGA